MCPLIGDEGVRSPIESMTRGVTFFVFCFELLCLIYRRVNLDVLYTLAA